MQSVRSLPRLRSGQGPAAPTDDQFLRPNCEGSEQVELARSLRLDRPGRHLADVYEGSELLVEEAGEKGRIDIGRWVVDKEVGLPSLFDPSSDDMCPSVEVDFVVGWLGGQSHRW